MTQPTPKERTLSVIERRSPTLVASTFKATPEVDSMMMKHFGVEDVEGLIPALNVCHLHWPWKCIGPRGMENVREENGVVFDVFGVGRREVNYGKGTYLETVYYPLASAETVSDVESYDWPSADDLDFSHIPSDCDKYSSYALSTWCWTLFERSWAMRGFENFLADMALDEKIATAIIRKVEEFNWQVIERIHDAVRGRIQFFGTGDDLGSQTSLLMSVEMWSKYFEPGYRRAYEFARKNSMHTWLHCDGAVRPLIPRLIDCGLEILDPLMPMIEEMSPYNIIPEFEKDLCFHGTIDVQNLLPFCKEQQVRDEVRRQMDELWPRGVLYMAPSHCIQSGTPIENILAVYDELTRYM